MKGGAEAREIESRRGRFATLSRVSRRITEGRDLKTVVQGVLEAACSMTDALLEEIAQFGGLAARARRLAGPAHTTPTLAQAAPGPEELFPRQQFIKDAEAVLDLVGFEVSEGIGQFRDGNDWATTVDSQSHGSTHGAAVQADPSWREVAPHADAERCVIDREDADAMDPVTNLPNNMVEFIEGRCFPYVPLPAERRLLNSRRTLQGIRHWCGCFPPSAVRAIAGALITWGRIGIARQKSSSATAPSR